MSEDLRNEYLDLLSLILRGTNTSAKMAVKLKIPRKTVSNRLSILYQKGYVDKEIVFNSRPYSLTSKGQNAMAAWLSTLSGRYQDKPTRLHAHKVTWYMDISKKPWELHDLLLKHAFVAKPIKGWHKYVKEAKGLKIVFNPNTVYVYMDVFYLENPMEYYDRAIDIMEGVKVDLESRFPGLVLGSPNKQMVVESNHIVRQYGPLAMKFYEESIKAGRPVVFHGKRLNVDFSQGPPEEETVAAATAPADMLALGDFFDRWLAVPFMPEDVHRIGSDVHETQAVVQQTRVVVHETMASVQEVRGSVQSVQADLGPLKEEVSGVRKDLGELSGTILPWAEDMSALMTAQVKNMDTFSTAMHEHVVLVKALQGVTQQQGESLAAFMGAQAQQSRAAREQADAVIASVGSLAAAVTEMATPWYVKAWRGIKKVGDKLWKQYVKQ